MKHTIPFEFFAKGQTIYFDILRLAELEKMLGDSILQIMRRADAGVTFVLAGLTVGLQHEYPQNTRAAVLEKLEQYFETGGTLDEVATPIVRAIVASGIFGKVDEARKNEEAPAKEKN